MSHSFGRWVITLTIFNEICYSCEMSWIPGTNGYQIGGDSSNYSGSIGMKEHYSKSLCENVCEWKCWCIRNSKQRIHAQLKIKKPLIFVSMKKCFPLHNEPTPNWILHICKGEKRIQFCNFSKWTRAPHMPIDYMPFCHRHINIELTKRLCVSVEVCWLNKK